MGDNGSNNNSHSIALDCIGLNMVVVEDSSSYADEISAADYDDLKKEEPEAPLPPTKLREEARQPEKKKIHYRTSFFDQDSSETKQNLVWTDVNMVLKSKSSSSRSSSKDTKLSESIEKRILDGVWGEAKAGELSAIMGASGAGKTSLFNILAGRAKSKGRIEIESDIRVGDFGIDPSQSSKVRKLFAFVSQEDALHPALTPRQSLFFSARLRLPRDMSDDEVHGMVDKYLEELGLVSCADTIVGGGLKKGISGGEKRRVSIGVELISQPQILFLDEPTSGLDSFAARQVLKLLEKVARAGNVVLFTIHQPSSEVFASFDKLILLSKGRIMYQGLVKDLNDDFERMGHPMPPNYNPADWLLDVAQTNSPESLESTGFFPKDTRGLAPPRYNDTIAFLKSIKSLRSMQDGTGTERRIKTASQWTQLKMLMEREKIAIVKNPIGLIIGICMTAFLAVVFGVIFFKVGPKDRAQTEVIQSQLGALVNINISTMMGQSQPALVVFAMERPLFLREYSTRHYSVVPYFLSKLATEAMQSFIMMAVQGIIVFYMIEFQQLFITFLVTTYAMAMTSQAVAVFLGSCFSRPESASSLFTLVVVPQFYFSGLFIALNLIPRWIRWVQYICSLTYASRIAFAYEFKDCDPGAATVNCENTLDQNLVNEDDVWWYWLAFAGLFVGFRFTAMSILKSRASEFD